MRIRGRRGKRVVCATIVAALVQAAPASPRTTPDPPCRHAGTPVERLTAANARSALRCLVAARRRDRGLPAVRTSPPLRRMALELARDMVQSGHRTHTTTGGGSLQRRARHHLTREFRSRWELGEAASWGSGAFTTPAALMDSLVRSAPHRRLLDDPRFRLSDVGLASRGDAAVAVVELARVRRSR